MRKLAPRPSPAMIVAMLALIVALSGTSFASSTVAHISALINGKKIKKGTIPGKALKKNTLTGVQINESKLGQVPSAKNADHAASADSATNATNASSLGGVGAAGFQTYGQRTIPSGTTVTGGFGIRSYLSPISSTTANLDEVVSLPGLAPADLTDANVNFAAAAGVSDTDSSCTGTATNPTAPPGKVCLYLTQGQGLNSAFDGEAIPGLPGSRYGFDVHATQPSSGGTGVWGSWAYTAP